MFETERHSTMAGLHDTIEIANMSTHAALGTLGFHLDGRPCRVGCAYCYLGARNAPSERKLDGALAAEIVAAADARDVAVAISEPASRWRSGLEAISAAARARGLPVAVTTTPDVVARDPWVTAGVSRLTVSVDPAKGDVDVAALRRVLAAVARPDLEIVALPSLVSAEYAGRLAGGLLEELLDAPEISAVALNGLKPPPPWCDRRFWIGFLARIRPLLDVHLGRRLHLDCYVAARILGLSACPAKPDVTAGREFRSCVYQAQPDFVFIDAADLARRTARYQAPGACPFAIA
jgi:hypothetical protein